LAIARVVVTVINKKRNLEIRIEEAFVSKNNITAGDGNGARGGRRMVSAGSSNHCYK